MGRYVSFSVHLSESPTQHELDLAREIGEYYSKPVGDLWSIARNFNPATADLVGQDLGFLEKYSKGKGKALGRRDLEGLIEYEQTLANVYAPSDEFLDQSVWRAGLGRGILPEFPAVGLDECVSGQVTQFGSECITYQDMANEHLQKAALLQRLRDQDVVMRYN